MDYFIINCRFYNYYLNIAKEYMNQESQDYLYTYQNVYKYNNYTNVLIILFLILLLIYILNICKKYF